jgi:hypothetical protein
MPTGKTPVVHRALPVLDDASLEGTAVRLGLKADQVVGGQRPDEALVGRKRSQNLRRRKRDVQEESDPVAHAETTEHVPEGNEVIVVHPDGVVRTEQRRERAGIARVDRKVPVELGLSEVDQSEPVVEERPQRRVREAGIVGLMLLRSEVERGVGHPPIVDDLRLGRRPGGDLPAPAEPHAADCVERLLQSHGQAAGLERAVTGQRNSVGDDHELRQNASSQLLESRVAELTRPTME